MVDLGSLMGGGLLAAFAAMGLVFMIVVLAFYIYAALALMAIAKKTKTPNGWLAFIPIANIYLMTQMAGISGWWTLAIFAAIIPIIGGLAILAGMIYLWWIIAEKINKPGWWSILMLIPIVNIIILGIMAWGK
jgi:hypothetical protein